MSRSEHVVVSWCRCGPYAETLGRIRARPHGPVEWQGSLKWVSEGIHLRPDQEVDLCEADLCHRPGTAHVIAHGRVVGVREGNERLTIKLEATPSLRLVPRVIPPGKLVALADVEPSQHALSLELLSSAV